MSTATELLDRLAQDVNALDQILLGDENVSVTLNGVAKPSISRAIHTRFTEYRTVSTSAPSGVPRDGEEWIVVD